MKVQDGQRVTWEDMYEQEHVGTVVDVLNVQALVECDDGHERFVFFNEPTLRVVG